MFVIENLNKSNINMAINHLSFFTYGLLSVGITICDLSAAIQSFGKAGLWQIIIIWLKNVFNSKGTTKYSWLLQRLCNMP